MSYFFSDVFRTAVGTDASFVTGAHIGMALFYGAPNFANNEPRYQSIDTVAELKAQLGWTEVMVEGYPLSNEVILGTRVSGDSTYAMMSEFPIDDDMLPAQVRAVAFYYKGLLGGVTNPLIMVSNTPVAPLLVLAGGDAISPAPSTLLVGENRYLFAWAGTGSTITLVEGPLATQKNAPEFEPAHTQHVWLYPQRVNMIANPSFEGGITHWRTSGTLTQVSVTLPGVGVKAGEFAGTAPVIIESNKFPGVRNDWTIRFLAKGEGQLKVGLLSWPIEYDETAVDWGTETWDLSPETFLPVKVLRSSAEIYEGQVRLELDGPEITIDQVICEPGYLLDWEYFDGDTTYGARDDFSWYGGENLKGQTYSLFYNNKRATAGRLFATKFPDRAASTSELELSEGLVYQWVPAGTLVEPHWDVLFEGDLQHQVPDVTGAVTPYRTATPGTPEYTTDMGVDNPWDPEEPVGP